MHRAASKTDFHIRRACNHRFSAPLRTPVICRTRFRRNRWRTPWRRSRRRADTSSCIARIWPRVRPAAVRMPISRRWMRSSNCCAEPDWPSISSMITPSPSSNRRPIHRSRRRSALESGTGRRSERPGGTPKPKEGCWRGWRPFSKAAPLRKPTRCDGRPSGEAETARAGIAMTEIIVTGTRQGGMQAAESPVPIQIISRNALQLACLRR